MTFRAININSFSSINITFNINLRFFVSFSDSPAIHFLPLSSSLLFFKQLPFDPGFVPPFLTRKITEQRHTYEARFFHLARNLRHIVRSYTEAQFEGQLHGTLGHRLMVAHIQLLGMIPWKKAPEEQRVVLII